MEKSFKSEIELLRLGQGQVFHGEGILAIIPIAVTSTGKVSRTKATSPSPTSANMRAISTVT